MHRQTTQPEQFTQKQELREIAAVIEKHEDVYVLADEIYEYINFTEEGHFSMGSIPELKDRVITVNGVAKGYAMTGWRIGFTAAAKWIADGVEKLQGQVTSGTNSIAQKAAVAAFNGPMEPSIEMTKAYARRRDLVVGLLKEIPGFKVNVPEGAFYAFPDVSYYFGKSDGTTTINDSDDFCKLVTEQLICFNGCRFRFWCTRLHPYFNSCC